MPIPLPNLDDRRWTDLVQEGLSRIPVYSPEWTNFNPSDPGITLMELFAWVAEMDIYQLNRVPDRHKRKFLELIGVRPAPPRPDRTDWAIPVSIAGSVAAGTSIIIGGLPFRTLYDVWAGPGSLKAIQTGDGFVFQNFTASLPGQPLPPFGVPPQLGSAVYFGLTEALPAGKVTSALFRFAGKQLGPDAGPHHSAVVAWEYLDTLGGWTPLTVVDTTRSFSTDGHVRITGPASMGSRALGKVADPLFYLRVRYVSGAYDTPPRLLSTLWNAVEAEQVETVSQTWLIAPGTLVSGPEPSPGDLVSVLFGFNQDDQIDSLTFGLVGQPQFRVVDYGGGSLTLELVLVARGTGGPGQLVSLDGGPAIVESGLSVYSLEGGAWRTWDQRLTFDSSQPADAHCVVDAQAATVQFGDGRRGRALPEDALLFASYLKTAAQNAETLSQAISRAVEQREASLRAITLEDYETLARATPGVSLARVSARANLLDSFDSLKALGVITVIVVPDMPVPMPRPSSGLLAAVRHFLNQRRVIGTRVEVIGPTYIQVAANATVKRFPGQNPTAVKRAVVDALNLFLDPLRGGPDATGWPFGRDVYEAEILSVIARVPGVDHVNTLALVPTGCQSTCGNICLRPSWLVTPGPHKIEVL